MLVSTAARIGPLGSDLGDGVGDIGAHPPLVDRTTGGDLGASLQQRGEPLLPLILVHRAGALAFQSFVDCGADQAGDRRTALSTELPQQTELPVVT